MASDLGLAFRFALREMRGGLAGFRVFLLAIALGVAAIAAVGSVSRSMTDGLAAEGRTILGGDVAFSLIQRQATDAERAFLAETGAVSEVAALRAMARRSDGADETLVELKAVDAAYPLTGTLTVESPSGPVPASLEPGAALIAGELAARLRLAAGDAVEVGRARFRVAGVIAREPDELATGLGFGPRLMIRADDLAATGLVEPGSLVRYLYRVRLPGAADDAAVKAVSDAANARFPEAGWQIRGRDDASPGLRRNIDQFAQYLTLVGLSALLVGGVGVANAVGAYLDGKRRVIATLRSLGAPGGFVVRLYLVQIALLAAIGILAGLAVGAAIAFFAADLLAAALSLPASGGAFHPGALGTAAAYGLATALVFALAPLGRARSVPPTALFRGGVDPNRRSAPRRYLVGALGMAAGLAGLAVLLAYDRRIALYFVVAAAGAFLALRLVGLAVTALARRAPRLPSAEWRLAIGNIHRPGALTGSVVLSLGLGLTLLVTIASIDGNLRRQLVEALPEQAPSFFFLDLRRDEMAGFGELVAERAPGARLETVPMLRGRIVALKGEPVDKVEPAAEARWALSGDRGITYSATVPENSRLVEGEWWPADYSGPPLVSFEAEVGRGLGLSIGDTVRVNVLGREVDVRVANFRAVQWESLAINFLMVFSPNTFAGAPHTVLATLAWPTPPPAETEYALMRDLATAYPTVTVVRVREALGRIADILGQLMAAIRAASAIALAASVLVLAGALAAGHSQRLYDAVILKTLGATRARLVGAFALEYALIGLATAIFGVGAGVLAAWGVVSGIMDQPYRVLFGTATLAAVGAVASTVVLGLVGTWRLLGRKAAPVLRDL
ncbi:ABC transporter permease [Prosthecomicrobium pneumaticum]|uniref:Putative ABC transport system permease protein n=1 Tax=Prosthecomicrobium pneumaticum TaxID=81895 RepID=A0A7W9FMM5_9HYPH|nr:FtsX-like permease family protein [Prosthecomicrobium pneumaticum]MBB5753421.1 putative ABC transport system permease protein [Prosthecomicrobium pneumaticum]